jgi:KTSC domain
VAPWKEAAMKRVDVESSCLCSVGYCSDSRVHEVEFASGCVYRHEGVSLEAHAALMAAQSLGRSFNASIKPHFDGRRVRS